MKYLLLGRRIIVFIYLFLGLSCLSIKADNVIKKPIPDIQIAEFKIEKTSSTAFSHKVKIIVKVTIKTIKTKFGSILHSYGPFMVKISGAGRTGSGARILFNVREIKTLRINRKRLINPTP